MTNNQKNKKITKSQLSSNNLVISHWSLEFKNLNKGFTTLDLLIVMSISVVLLLAAGFLIYNSQKKGRALEQSVRTMVADIRLVQSNALAVQTIGDSIPKAAVVRVASNQAPEIYYYSGSCNSLASKLDRRISLGGTAVVSSVSPFSPIYLIYTTPFGRFYVTNVNPSFTNSINGSCAPLGALNSDVNINLTNGSQNYRIEINNKTGELTIF